METRFQLNERKREEPSGAPAAAMAPAMELALRASFGSTQGWREDFVSMRQALGGSSGCVLLLFQPRDGTLVNRSATDPAHTPTDGVPLLALGVDAVIEDIPWDAVYERYQHAVEQASEAFGAGQDEIEGVVLLDVRRSAIFEQSQAVIPGAEWHDPGAVGDWAAALPAGREVVVYCVYGHEVGRATALRLRAAGIAARYLRGGIDAWKTAGKPLQAKGGVS